MSKNTQRRVSALSRGRYDMRNGIDKKGNPYTDGRLHGCWRSGWLYEEAKRKTSIMGKVKKFFGIGGDNVDA